MTLYYELAWSSNVFLIVLTQCGFGTFGALFGALSYLTVKKQTTYKLCAQHETRSIHNYVVKVQ